MLPVVMVKDLDDNYILYDDDIEIDTSDVGGADDHGVSGDAFGALLDDC